MNELQIVIGFFAFLFAGSLFYSAKRKSESLFSFIINLELEYIVVGIVLFVMAESMLVPMTAFKGIMHLLLAFMGLALGTHFSIKLLLDVPYRFYIFSITIYLALLPFLYIILRSMGSDHPLMMAITFNTLMPYSLNLSMKLFRVSKDKVFVSSLTASLFPLITLIAYTIAAGVDDYRPVDFSKSVLAAFFIAFVFLHYGKVKSKKSVNNLSVLFVVIVSGLAVYYSISPLVIGFLTGLLKADTKYGNIFQDISIRFERILYIFFYVALGVMLGFGYSFSIKTFSIAGALYISFFLVRMLLAKALAYHLFPTKGECICLLSTGILPAVLLLDYGTRHGYMNIKEFFMPLLLLHVAAEITTYFMVKNERKIN
ncbi:MAG: hypothetical protein C0602_01470 [Denitrovibrio sp.]|nr:MAG: hypothetical protein C0602_01470 [Denitrovibrio sp.]